MLSIDVSSFVHKKEPTYIPPFETKAWVTNIGVGIEQDAVNYPRDLTCKLRYLLECPRLRELKIVGRRNIVKDWAKKWTGELKDVDLNILEAKDLK